MLYAIIAIILLVLVIVGLIWYYHRSSDTPEVKAQQNELTKVVQDVATQQAQEARNDALHAATTSPAVLLNELYEPNGLHQAGPPSAGTVPSPRISGFSANNRH